MHTSTSDFLQSSTVHHLLYRVFCAETGLQGVASRIAQHDALTRAAPKLRAFVLAHMAEDVSIDFELPDGTALGTLVLPVKADAQLFIELYGKPDVFLDEDKVFDLHVHPLIGRMLERNTVMRGFVLAQLEHHMRANLPAVGEYLLTVLPAFGLRTFVSELRSRLRQPAQCAK